MRRNAEYLHTRIAQRSKFAHHLLLVIAALRAAEKVCTNALLEATHARATTAPVAPRMTEAMG
jgi:hypothetical protein